MIVAAPRNERLPNLQMSGGDGGDEEEPGGRNGEHADRDCERNESGHDCLLLLIVMHDVDATEPSAAPSGGDTPFRGPHSTRMFLFEMNAPRRPP